MRTASIDDVISSLRQGRMVILADDEQRENEGDFVMAAQLAEAEHISFMAEHARTIITLALTGERCDQLGLSLMAEAGGNRQDTAFTVTIEAARGVTTGSSAHDRVRTIRAALAPDARPSDLVSPGHVFPLRAVPGGVLARAGHTEAACDLARLAGFEPAGLISEIQMPDGEMARMPDLNAIAQEHGLQVATISSLISYRMEKESLVARRSTSQLETSDGQYTAHHYRDLVSDGTHVALVKGEPDAAKPPLVRVIANPNFIDCLSLDSPARSWSVPAALRYFADEPNAVLLALHVDMPFGLEVDADSTPGPSGASQMVRTHGIGAQILRDLGVSEMRLLSSPLRLPSMEGFGLQVTETIQPQQKA